MRNGILFFCAMLLPGLVSAQDDQFDPPPNETPDGLVRFMESPFELAYLKPGVDLSRYTRIQVRPIDISYADTPPTFRPGQHRERNYSLTDEQRSRVSGSFSAAFTKAMTHDGRFKLTTEKGYDTLMVRVALANIAVHVPTRGDKTLLVDEAAKVTLVVELRDSLTNEPLARGRDSQSATLASGSYQPSDPEELRTEVRRVFAEWSRLLREGFDRFSNQGR